MYLIVLINKLYTNLIQSYLKLLTKFDPLSVIEYTILSFMSKRVYTDSIALASTS